MRSQEGRIGERWELIEQKVKIDVKLGSHNSLGWREGAFFFCDKTYGTNTLNSKYIQGQVT